MKKSMLLMVFLTLLCVFAFAAGGKEEEAGAAAKPTAITIYRGGLSENMEEDPVVQELNKRLNVNLSFITAPWSENRQKINLLLAAGEPVDAVTTVDNPEHWQEQGAIVAYDDYISESSHPYIYKLVNSDTFTPMKIGGKAYAIPQVTIGVAWGTMVRQDWMEGLGLEMPTDEEELYEVLKAFKENDPTGTTVGIQFEGDRQIRRTSIPIMSIFGVPSSFWDQAVNFVVRNDKLYHITREPNTKAALKYMNRLYNEGLINRDFPSMNSFPKLTEKYIMSGKAGMGWVIGPFTQQALRLKEIDPSSEVSVLQPFSAKGHDFSRAQGIMRQSNVVVTQVSENQQKAIDCLEYFNSYEGRQLLVAGVEDIHWTEFTDDGYFKRIEETWKRDYGEQIYHPLNFYLGQGNSEGYIPAKDYTSFEEAQAHAVAFVPFSQKGKRNLKVEYEEGAKWVGEPNPFQFVTFAEYNDLRVEVDEAIYTGWTRCIAAKSGEFERVYQEYLDELSRVGLDSWIALYQEYYDDNIK